VQLFNAGMRVGVAEKDLSGSHNKRKTDVARKNRPDREPKICGLKKGVGLDFSLPVIETVSNLFLFIFTCDVSR
jgi:hypothetical protein